MLLATAFSVSTNDGWEIFSKEDDRLVGELDANLAMTVAYFQQHYN